MIYNFLRLRRNLLYSAFFLIGLLLLVGFRADATSSQPGVVRKGVMTLQTYNRLVDIDIRSHTQGKLSDADVEWALSLLKSKPPRDTLRNRETLHSWAIAHIIGCKGLITSQKEKFYDACMGLIASKSDWDKITAIIGLGSLHDARAVPTIRRIAARHSRKSQLGKWARDTLREDFSPIATKGH
jgi:hypothetical protein